ncbi:Spy0128 family protein [Collinsella aerofaciens]|uniref:Spy0128 family protein n=1 Tax=Collinsella aerofaciens TaxID=74426 RepID=UPI003DA5A2CF
MAATEGEQTEAAPDEIKDVDELKTKLANASGVASFKLMNDVETGETITLSKDGSKITLDLNGHKIKHTSSNRPLFNITGGATLTVKDSQQAAATEISANQENKWSNLASMEYGDSNIPTKLTYYVTESVASGTGTNETLKAYEAGIKGAIVACGGNANLKLINLYATNDKGGTFNLESGVITQQQQSSATQQQQSSVSSLVYAENGSSVNMRGGYICGASGSGAGGGIEVRYNSSLSISNGVIAGNSAPSGGGVYAEGSTVKVTGGTISGNRTLENTSGFGGGVMVVGGSIAVSGGFITNNKYANFCNQDGYGDHGGAGLAAKNGTHVTISGGQITGNYSQEAGGGVYVTDVDRNKEPSRSGMAWLNITGGIIASNVSYRSEGAGIRVGQMVDAMINGSSNDSPVYITNNSCMSRFDWGGGGIFVQGNSDLGKEKTAGRLFIYNSYISANTAGGYGGGVAVCPTGKTLVTNTEGTAIFGNSSAKDQQDAKADYNSEKNSGNEGTPHLSAGGYEGLEHKKNQDTDAYNAKEFRENGHADFFLAAEDHKTPIAAVIGKMLGGGDAKYKGSKELTQAITIPANGGVQVYKSIGLSSGVTAQDEAAINAQKVATTFITGNYSWDHGGGIMSNGDLYLGQPADTYVYPSLKLKATKALSGRALKEGEFSFAVYRKDSDSATAPYWNNKTFNNGDCTFVGSAKNSADGNITFDLGEQFLASDTGEITYYLVEDAGKDPDVDYDHAVYEIKVTVEDHTTVLMSVPTQNDPNATKDLKVHNYTIKSVNVKNLGASTALSSTVPADADGYYSIANSDGSKTFNNTYTLYTSDGSWTPKATKVVKGGEMKEFTLEFADNEKFEDAKTVKTTADGTNNPQTLSFVDKITYKLNDLNKGEDPTGRGASKTFTYYVREQQLTTPFTNYKYDKSVYKITVTATDQSDKTIKCDVTYTKIVNADGKDIPEKEQKPVTYVPAKDEATGKEQSVPVFTNTYSTSLPLSGMSGVTLTYLAGAAVLCAAAAWMHIRRKANAKGGERRE